MTDRELDLPGARLAFDVQQGDGPVALALHGLTASRAVDDAGGVFGWSEVAAAGRTLVRADARGHGRSTGDLDPGAYTWYSLADDLLATADAVSPDVPVDGIGVSMGTATLLHAAVRRPGRFRRLVLALPPTAWTTRAAVADGYRQAAVFVERRGLDAFARGQAALPQPPLLAELGRDEPGPDVEEPLLPTVLRGAAASDLPPAEAIAALSQPVLLLPWIGDPGHPMSTAERLAELLPHARLAPMRTVGDLLGAGAQAAAFLTAEG